MHPKEGRSPPLPPLGYTVGYLVETHEAKLRDEQLKS